MQKLGHDHYPREWLDTTETTDSGLAEAEAAGREMTAAQVKTAPPSVVGEPFAILMRILVFSLQRAALLGLCEGQPPMCQQGPV